MLSDKVVLITGGSQGLGLAFAEILLEHNLKVSFCDVNENTGQETLKNLQRKYGESRVMFQKCDVTNHVEMAAFFKQTKDKLGGLDIVINNAGIGEQTTAWERTIDVNLNGMIRGTYLALDYMRTDKGGRGGVIVNVSSAAGLRANPLSPVYCASKSGVLAFSQSLAYNEDVINGGVRINVLCPAFADTALVTTLYSEESPNSSKVRNFIDQIGIMTTREVAEGLLELVIDDTKNGAILKMSKLSGKEYVSLECKALKS